MSLPRTLEPELMDSREEVWAYDAMDHRDVNRVFVNDFLEALQAAGLFSEGSLCLTTRPDDARFVDCACCHDPNCRSWHCHRSDSNRAGTKEQTSADHGD